MEKIAAKDVNKLVVISENRFPNDLPKYPSIAPTKGRNKTAYII